MILHDAGTTLVQGQWTAPDASTHNLQVPVRRELERYVFFYRPKVYTFQRFIKIEARTEVAEVRQYIDDPDENNVPQSGFYVGPTKYKYWFMVDWSTKADGMHVAEGGNIDIGTPMRNMHAPEFKMKVYWYHQDT